VLAIEVEHVDTGCGTCCDANQRARISSPQLRKNTPIAACLLEPMRRCRALVGRAREAAASIRAQCQSGIERRLHLHGRHDPAPLFRELSERGVRFPAVTLGAAAGAIRGAAGSLCDVRLGRRIGEAASSSGAGGLGRATIGASVRKARQSSSRTIVRRPIFLARSLPAAIAL
jgi:hypothetical protein